MKSILTTLTLLIFSTPAFAQFEDLTCLAPDCLTGGFQITDSNGGFQEIAFCSFGDCNANGWVIQDLFGATREVQCSPAGCYNEGFQEFDQATGDLIRTRTCKDGGTGISDCLTHGWTDQVSGATPRVEEVSASNGVSVQDGFIIQEVEDNTAQLEAELEALRADRKQKKKDLRAYLKSLTLKEKFENRATIRAKVKEIVVVSKQIRKKKKEIRNGAGPVVVAERTATCKDSTGAPVDASQNPGSCFINGYIAQ